MAVDGTAAQAEGLFATSSWDSSWDRLPVEINLMILNLLYADLKDSTVRFIALPKLATVCRQWQAFVETRTFETLVIENSSLDMFESACQGDNAIRLGYIRHIGLHIILEGYECHESRRVEDQYRARENNHTFTKCIMQLLRVLSAWSVDDYGGRGLTLEIGAFSPGDSRHALNSCAMNPRYPYQTVADLRSATKPSITDYHLAHETHYSRCWHSHLEEGNLVEMLQKIQGTPLQLWDRGLRGYPQQPPPVLPKTPIVRQLLLRRRFRRSIDIATLSLLFRECFIAVHVFRYERWVSFEPEEEQEFRQGVEDLLIPALPVSLSGFYMTHWHHPGRQRLLSSRFPSRNMAGALATSPVCRGLMNFCPPYQMDVEYFLSYFDPGTSQNPRGSQPVRWENLRALSLRCTTLHPSRSQVDFTNLLCLAARCIVSFPKLSHLELWNFGEQREPRFAYIFRCTIIHRRAGIGWHWFTTEHFCLTREIITAWGKATADRAPYGLWIKRGPFGMSDEEFHFPDPSVDRVVTHRHLVLRKLYLDPVTEKQLEAEAEVDLWWESQ